MPLLQVDVDVAAKAVASAPTDLVWLFGDCDVDVHVQGVLFHSGFDKVRRFIGMGETRAEVKAALSEHLGMNAADSLAMRVQVASILSAWDAAREHVHKESAAKMDAKTSGVARPVTQTEHQSMRSAYEAQWGKLRNDECPSKAYVGYKSDEVEENEPKAESLKEVHAKDDPEQDFLSTTIALNGEIKVRKGSQTAKEPVDPEELRAKWKLIATCWMFLKLKHSNRPWLSDITPKKFQDSIDYILGRKVYGLRGSGGGNVEVAPTWIMMLNYELEFRKKVYDLVVSDGKTMGVALDETCHDQNLVTMHLVTPMTLATRSNARSKDDFPRQSHDGGKKFPRHDKGRGKGRNEVKGDGKGKGKNKLKSKFQGRDICYKYNNNDPDNVCDGSCQRLHICQVCLKKGCKASDHK